MGMFDNLTCDCWLPRPGFEGRVFQTKSLPDPYLEHYRITQSGRLEVLEYSLVEVEREAGDPLRGSIPCFRRENEQWTTFSYTGEIRFYDFEVEGDYITSKLVHFVAWFEDGMLVRGPIEVKRDD